MRNAIAIYFAAVCLANAALATLIGVCRSGYHHGLMQYLEGQKLPHITVVVVDSWWVPWLMSGVALALTVMAIKAMCSDRTLTLATLILSISEIAMLSTAIIGLILPWTIMEAAPLK